MSFPTIRFVVALLVLALTAGCSRLKNHVVANNPQILFVCEHGNVKSLMAASYFNQMAQERGLSVRAVARGSAPNSTTVPPAIAQSLRGDGFDVSAFHPSAVSASDLSASQRVITIGTALPSGVQGGDSRLEQWNDVPPTSVSYDATRESLKSHVKDLVEQMSHP